MTVADTSPISYLGQLGILDILPALYGRIFVPPAVISELSALRAPAPVRALALNPPSWFEIRAPAHRMHPFQSLDIGEADAICLALELDADRLLIDDQPGRIEAIKYGS
jgi:predicted nucleic acid-binding protein